MKDVIIQAAVYFEAVVMIAEQKTLTTEEFWEFVEQAPDDRQYELVDGVLVKMPPSNPINSAIAARIIFLIQLYLYENNLKGHITGADGGLEIAPNTVRAPDVAYISLERAPKLEKRMRVAPDLAVEVISPGETAGDVHKKIDLYLKSGTRIVWAVYPEERAIEVWRRSSEAGKLVKTYGMDDRIAGEEVLPGMELRVKDVFDV